MCFTLIWYLRAKKYFIIIHLILLYCSTFLEARPVRVITAMIKEYYTEPWPTWKKVPNTVKNQMWVRFQVYMSISYNVIYLRHSFFI